jgi:hypothetical protein
MKRPLLALSALAALSAACATPAALPRRAARPPAVLHRELGARPPVAANTTTAPAVAPPAPEQTIQPSEVAALAAWTSGQGIGKLDLSAHASALRALGIEGSPSRLVAFYGQATKVNMDADPEEEWVVELNIGAVAASSTLRSGDDVPNECADFGGNLATRGIEVVWLDPQPDGSLRAVGRRSFQDACAPWGYISADVSTEDLRVAGVADTVIRSAAWREGRLAWRREQIEVIALRGGELVSIFAVAGEAASYREDDGTGRAAGELPGTLQFVGARPKTLELTDPLGAVKRWVFNEKVFEYGEK